MTLPSKQECFYILEMIESELIDFSYTFPWAEALIDESEVPPSWLCDIAIRPYQGHQSAAIREFVCSEPFESSPEGIERFHVACLWLRHERRELSWATFLGQAGDFLDAASCGNWYCETPYHYLNMYEDEYFSDEAELRTKELLVADWPDLADTIQLAKEKFEPFRRIRRADKVSSAKG